MFGTKYALQNLYIYFSFIFNKSQKDIFLDEKDVYYLMLLLDILFYLLLLIGLKLNDHLNIRLCILISLIIQFTAFGMLFFFYKKYYIVLTSIGLLNLGNGLINLSTIRNCWKYFPKNCGTINGFLLSATGICSSLLTLLGELYFINPERKEIDKNKEFFENEDDLNNFQFFLFIIGCVLAVCGIIGLMFNFHYKEECNNTDDIIDNETGDDNDSISDYILNKRGSLHKKKTIKISINNALCSGQNIRLIFFCFFGLRKYNNNLINNKYCSCGFFNINLL